MLGWLASAGGIAAGVGALALVVVVAKWRHARAAELAERARAEHAVIERELLAQQREEATAVLRATEAYSRDTSGRADALDARHAREQSRARAILQQAADSPELRAQLLKEARRLLGRSE